ncbi:hypothetical protein L204_102384 [Cryptococcus depauperatus]
MSTEQPAKPIRGPVEEVVAKRMKALGKKLQRFKAYASQPEGSLNADQKAGVASLPTLKSVFKELEELSKQIEYVELEQAGKVRELKEQTKKDTEAHVVSRVKEFQSDLASPLSLFLRLHQLLHPAQSSDHDHLTVGRLELPRNMQDVVQATDVLRVGRWHEDLLAGGEKGRTIIALLVTGPGGIDEEDDHVHHLLKLLEESYSLPDEQELAVTIEAEKIEAIQAPETAEEPQEVLGEQSTDHKEASLPHQKCNTGLVFNFLQADELNAPSTQKTQSFISESTASVPNDHQATIPQNDVSFDWAAEEDTTSHPSLATSEQAELESASEQTLQSLNHIQAETESKNDETIDQTIEENVLTNTHTVQPTSVAEVPPVVAESSASDPVSKENIPSGSSNRGRGRGKGYSKHSSRQQKVKNQNQPSQENTGVDGFLVVGKHQSQGQEGQGQGQRSRGRGKWRGRGHTVSGGRGEARAPHGGPREDQSPEKSQS